MKILIVVLAALCFGGTAWAQADVLDQFDTGSGFTSDPVVVGDPSLCHINFADGAVHISHEPRDIYNSCGTSKIYAYDLSQTTWFDFKFRFGADLLGQDQYTSLAFLDSQNQEIGTITVGINSEQHWRQVYADGSHDPACTAKDGDDEFFISASSTLFGGASDIRISYPHFPVYKKPYTEWTVFSIRYLPPGASGYADQGRFSFFVDGREVSLENLDAPGQYVSPLTRALNGLTRTNIKLSLVAIVDGFEHGHPGNKYGRRARGCYASKCPAVPSPIVWPTKFDGNDGSALKPDWLKKFDTVAEALVRVMFEYLGPSGDYPFRSALLPYGPIVRLSGTDYESWVSDDAPRGARSSVDWLHVVEPANPNGFVGFYRRFLEYYATSASLRQDAAGALWNGRDWQDGTHLRGIYEGGSGAVDFETAVLMGAIDLPPPSHVMWQYCPPGTRDRLLAALNGMNYWYPPSMSQPEKFIWSSMYGGSYQPTSWADVVHLGYLAPEAVRASAAWQHLSQSERNTIPADSVPTTAELYWDFFRIGRAPL